MHSLLHRNRQTTLINSQTRYQPCRFAAPRPLPSGPRPRCRSCLRTVTRRVGAASPLPSIPRPPHAEEHGRHRGGRATAPSLCELAQPRSQLLRTLRSSASGRTRRLAGRARAVARAASAAAGFESYVESVQPALAEACTGSAPTTMQRERPQGCPSRRQPAHPSPKYSATRDACKTTHAGPSHGGVTA